MSTTDSLKGDCTLDGLRGTSPGAPCVKLSTGSNHAAGAGVMFSRIGRSGGFATETLMKIAILDPGLTSTSRHNVARFEEFCREFSEPGYQCLYVVHQQSRLGALEPQSATLLPLCSLNGYTSLLQLPDEPDVVERVVAQTRDELSAVDFSDCDVIIMPTVYPLHLLALAQCLASCETKPTLKLALGLRIPLSHWAEDADTQQHLGQALLAAISGLQARLSVCLYSETGRYRFGQTIAQTAVLLPPVTAATQAAIQSRWLPGVRQVSDRPLVLGYFGSPLVCKGLQPLLQAYQQAVQSGRMVNTLKLCLPPGNDEVLNAFAAVGGPLQGSSQPLRNEDYLAQMAQVDVVILPYDPRQYDERMATVMIEALSLGKAVAFPEDCASLLRFADTQAPGSHVVFDYSVDSITQLLMLQRTSLAGVLEAARQNAAAILAQRAMGRYFAAIGVSGVPSAVAATMPRIESAHRPTPIASIVIPTYNRESLVQESIAAALLQTVANIEVVVVDNASTDRTERVVREIAERDNRVRYFRNTENVGPVRNWIAGINHARADYVKLMFSDDLIRPTYIEKTLPYLLDADVAFAVCPAIIGNSPWQGNAVYAHLEQSGLLTSALYEHLATSFNYSFPVSPGAALFRRKDMLTSLRTQLEGHSDYDFAETGAGVDFLIYLLTARKYAKVAFHAEPLVFFRAHPGSITIDGMGGKVQVGYSKALAWFQRVQQGLIAA